MACLKPCPTGKAPHYSGGSEASHLTGAHECPIDRIVDSTGLKTLGCGEWNAHKHNASKKRRDWRKLHIGVDTGGFIVAAELTTSSREDCSTLPDLLDQIKVPIRRFTADGTYDHRSVWSHQEQFQDWAGKWLPVNAERPAGSMRHFRTGFVQLGIPTETEWIEEGMGSELPEQV